MALGIRLIIYHCLLFLTVFLYFWNGSRFGASITSYFVLKCHAFLCFVMTFFAYCSDFFFHSTDGWISSQYQFPSPWGLNMASSKEPARSIRSLYCQVLYSYFFYSSELLIGVLYFLLSGYLDLFSYFLFFWILYLLALWSRDLLPF